MQKKLSNIESELNNQDNWNNTEKTNSLLKEKSEIENITNKYNNIQTTLTNASDLYELAKTENNIDIFKDILLELKELENKVYEFKIENLFTEESDHNDCFIEINTGVGGVDACDFSEMILNMYIKWAEKKNKI